MIINYEFLADFYLCLTSHNSFPWSPTMKDRLKSVDDGDKQFQVPAYAISETPPDYPNTCHGSRRSDPADLLIPSFNINTAIWYLSDSPSFVYKYVLYPSKIFKNLVAEILS